MKKFSSLSTISLIAIVLIFQSCSSGNDLKEYGYKGKVKEVKATFYYDFIEENGKMTVDKSRIGDIRTMYFDENGNLTKTVSSSPNTPNAKLVSYYQSTDGRKSSYVVVDENKDTLERASIKWISDQEYEVTSAFGTGRIKKIHTLLNDDYVELSNETRFFDKDSTYVSVRYDNISIKENRVEESTHTDKLTGVKTDLLFQYSEFDAEGNPLRVELSDRNKKNLANVTIREISYY